MRPIVLVDNLSKTQAAERIHQIQKAHGEMELRQAADQVKKKVASDVKKSRESEKTDMVVIRREQEKEDHQKKKETKSAKTGQDDQSNEHLDLTA